MRQGLAYIAHNAVYMDGIALIVLELQIVLIHVIQLGGLAPLSLVLQGLQQKRACLLNLGGGGGKLVHVLNNHLTVHHVLLGGCQLIKFFRFTEQNAGVIGDHLIIFLHPGKLTILEGFVQNIQLLGSGLQSVHKGLHSGQQRRMELRSLGQAVLPPIPAPGIAGNGEKRLFIALGQGNQSFHSGIHIGIAGLLFGQLQALVHTA